MSSVIVYTPAYNAEKTLRRTIDSILSQTYTDFIYYLLDNAATDKTSTIIDEYAQQDNRIIPLHNKINHAGNWISDVIKNHDDNCYICELDADDEYSPTFIEKMISFIKSEHLDIAGCGNNFVNAVTGRLTGVRQLDNNLVFEGTDFDKHFLLYYQFMRTIWGKVFSLSVLRKSFYNNYEVKVYGGDTFFTLNAFYNAKRVGILAEPLHKYYMSPKSISYKFDSKRIKVDGILFNATRDFLISKCGRVSPQNLNFLFAVYLNAIKDTINILLNARINIMEKLIGLRDIFQSQHTQELIQQRSAEFGLDSLKKELFGSVVSWLFSQKETRSGEGMELASEILAAMKIYPPEIDGWHGCRVFSLLTKIRNKLHATESSEKVDAQIVTIASKTPSLAGLGAGFLTFFHDITFSVLRHDEQKALKQIKDILAKETDIPDEYAVPFLALGLNLSAGLKQSDDFIYFKKLQISTLIALSKYDEALKQLADWDTVLPDDPDFKEFRLELTKSA